MSDIQLDARIKGNTNVDNMARALGLKLKDAKGSALVGTPECGRCIEFLDRDQTVSDVDRFLNLLAVLTLNVDLVQVGSSFDLVKRIDQAIDAIDAKVNQHLSHIYEHGVLRRLEANWRGLADLVKQVETDEVIIDVLDVSKEELRADFADHGSDIFSSDLFKKVYIEEYDRYGGKPFGAMIGLYEFVNGGSDGQIDDIEWLSTMADIANAAHCPFISAASPKFFDDRFTGFDQLEGVSDVEAYLQHPRFGKWDALRDRNEAAYIGLTLPRYLLRKPWTEESKDWGNKVVGYTDPITSPGESYLWGNSAILFGRNMVRSFENSGWCQYLRGPKGGGLIQGMTVHTFQVHGKEELMPPVEVQLADYRELQFSKCGFNALIHHKDKAEATFFSAQSIKKPKDFVKELDTQNAYLVTNLAYTLSITRIAHYVKKMMREYIGSSANGPYIENTLQLWLNDYITTTVNPDDLTLQYYPFKAVQVAVVPKPGPLGWYKATIKILPHIQFEGMDVELQLEAALGGK